MIQVDRDNDLLKGHVWKIRIHHHLFSLTASIDDTPMLYLKRNVDPPLNPKKKKRNRETLRIYRTFRATILDDIATILGHEQFGRSYNHRTIEKWEEVME